MAMSMIQALRNAGVTQVLEPATRDMPAKRRGSTSDSPVCPTWWSRCKLLLTWRVAVAVASEARGAAHRSGFRSWAAA